MNPLMEAEEEFIAAVERHNAKSASGVTTPTEGGTVYNSRRAPSFQPYPFPRLQRKQLELVA